jgi:hypothetical protein
LKIVAVTKTPGRHAPSGLGSTTRALAVRGRLIDDRGDVRDAAGGFEVPVARLDHDRLPDAHVRRARSGTR